MVPLLAAFLVVPVLAAGVVYADARRRGLSAGSRLLWTGTVAAVSYAGFLGASLSDSWLFRAYAGVTGSPLVVTTPRELLSWVVVAGLAVSAASVLVYGFGSRIARVA